MDAKATKFNPQPNSWQEMITAKLKEFTLLWKFAYGQHSEKLIDPFLANFRTKLIRISEEIITLLSWSTKRHTNRINKHYWQYCCSTRYSGTKAIFRQMAA